MRFGSKATALLLSTCASGWLAVPAYAQTTGQQPSASDNVEVVIVTGTRRATADQRVPISLTVVGGETLREAVVRDTQSLQALAPSLVITVANSETTSAVVRIRGVGTTGQNPGLEPTVGVFVDGVYLPRSGIALNELADVERVEILRGPQGTLFGKNTTAGAIAIVTRKPEFTTSGEIFAGAGSFGSSRAGFSWTGPLVDEKLAVRLSGNFNQRDGYVDDLRRGEAVNDRGRWMVRGQALWHPNEEFSLRIIGDVSKKDEACCSAPYVLNGSRAPLIASLGGTVFQPTRENDLVIATNVKPSSETDDMGISAEATWSLDTMEARILVSSRNFDSVRDSDSDFSDLDLNNLFDERFKDETKTFEATLKGKFGAVDWLIGTFGFDQSFTQSSTAVLGTDTGRFAAAIAARPAIASLYAAGDGDIARTFFLDAQGWSVFTHNIWSITDRLDLTLGVRWNSEEKSGGGRFVTRAAAACTSPLVPAALRLICPTKDYDADHSDESMSGTIAASYAISPNALVFSSFARGFKAGGVSLDRDAGNRSVATFDPETSQSFEFGFKTEWMNRRLRANLTIFDQSYQDFQRIVFTGTESLLSNEGEVFSKGVEFEGRARLGAGVTLTSAITYNDTSYGANVKDASLAGKRMNAAPELTQQFGLSWQGSVASGFEGFARANWRHQSKTVTGGDLDPLKNQPAYGLLNASLGLTHTASQTEVTIWGTNLTDQRYRVVTFNSILQPGSLNAFMGEPRLWGIELRKSF